MRRATLTLFALLALTTEIAQAGTFNQASLQSEAIMISGQQPSASCLRYGDRGQLSEEDVSQIASVQPSLIEPLKPVLLTGVRAHRGQLGEDDIAQIRSVQPVGAIMLP